jgi:hypothetical protein
LGVPITTVVRVKRYTKEQLDSAVRSSSSWRGVLRELGSASTSAVAIRAVRSDAVRLGIRHEHFRGQRGWTDQQLEDAVRQSTSWAEVVTSLGLTGGSSGRAVRGHAERLDFDTTHLSPQPVPAPQADLLPRAANLSRAGSMLAAAWFELCGSQVSWPLEPCRYDLLVVRERAVERVQVKTTTHRVGRSWKVHLSTTRQERWTYGSDEIDQFFIIDGDFAYYLVPIKAVGGLTAIHLTKYQEFRGPARPLSG